jgi:hypothetical protein
MPLRLWQQGFPYRAQGMSALEQWEPAQCTAAAAALVQPVPVIASVPLCITLPCRIAGSDSIPYFTSNCCRHTPTSKCLVRSASCAHPN